MNDNLHPLFQGIAPAEPSPFLRLPRRSRLYALTVQYLERRISDVQLIDALTDMGLSRDTAMRLDDQRSWYEQALPLVARAWLDGPAGYGETNRDHLNRIGRDAVVADYERDDAALNLTTRQLGWSRGGGVSGWRNNMIQARGVEMWLVESAGMRAAAE